jgi:hypothetical protein
VFIDAEEGDTEAITVFATISKISRVISAYVDPVYEASIVANRVYVLAVTPGLSEDSFDKLNIVEYVVWVLPRADPAP